MRFFAGLPLEADYYFERSYEFFRPIDCKQKRKGKFYKIENVCLSTLTEHGQNLYKALIGQGCDKFLYSRLYKLAGDNLPLYSIGIEILSLYRITCKNVPADSNYYILKDDFKEVWTKAFNEFVRKHVKDDWVSISHFCIHILNHLYFIDLPCFRNNYENLFVYSFFYSMISEEKTGYEDKIPNIFLPEIIHNYNVHKFLSRKESAVTTTHSYVCLNAFLLSPFIFYNFKSDRDIIERLQKPFCNVDRSWRSVLC